MFLNESDGRKGVRRGSVYIAVLGVATFVAVVGLSALLSVRVQQSAACLNEAAIQADFYAQSTADLAMYWLCADPNWRTTYTNDTWTTDHVDGPVRFSFKLVDELDGNLANDPTQPVRLYARATSGSALRMYSVQLQPRSVTNILSNGGMENGTANWTAVNCTLAARTDTPHSGAAYLLVGGRITAAAGPIQVVSALLENGATYQFEFWMASTAGAMTAVPTLQITASGSGTQVVTGTSTAVALTWTKVTCTFPVSWTGTLMDARVGVATVSSRNPFDFDDAVLGKVLTGPSLAPVRGTWRREVSTIQTEDPVSPGGDAGGAVVVTGH